MSAINQPRLRKKTRLRAFTLTECLVALAILGIAAMTMAQVFSAVSKMSRDNEFMNISLSEQMKYVETRSGDTITAVPIPSAPGPLPAEKTTHIIDTSRYRVFITGGPRDNSGALASTHTNFEYEYGVNMFILYSRDGHDTAAGDTGYDWDGMYDESEAKLRYKYLLPDKPV